MNMSQGQQTATGMDPFALAMGMMAQMMAANAERNRSRDRDNAYAITREANRAVNAAAMGGRSGPSKGSGGRSSGAKRRELQEGIKRRQEGRAKRREESIARNRAASEQRKRDAKFRSAERQADRLEADIAKLGADVDSYVRGVQEGRAAEAVQASRDAYYGSRPESSPLDALTIMGGVQTPQVVALEGRTPFTAPEGAVTTEMALGPDPMVDVYRQQDGPILGPGGPSALRGGPGYDAAPLGPGGPSALRGGPGYDQPAEIPSRAYGTSPYEGPTGSPYATGPDPTPYYPPTASTLPPPPAEDFGPPRPTGTVNLTPEQAQA